MPPSSSPLKESLDHETSGVGDHEKDKGKGKGKAKGKSKEKGKGKGEGKVKAKAVSPGAAERSERNRGKSTESARLYTIAEGNQACKDVQNLLNAINANTIVDTHDTTISSASSIDQKQPSGGDEEDGSPSTRLMPLQRLQQTYRQAGWALQHIERSQHLRTGTIGPTNTGKSHMSNDFLDEHLMTDHYKHTDSSAATTLSDKEKAEAFRHFPARAAENKTAAVTLRPTVFLPTTGPVRVTREAHTKESLQALLDMSNISNKRELLHALVEVKEEHTMFAPRELYVDKSFTNCWDAFKAATSAIQEEEEKQATSGEPQIRRELQYLSWSHCRYEGPWGNLYNKLGSPDAHIEWWDLPGLTDPHETRRLLSFHCARQLHVVLLVTTARMLEPDDLNRLSSLLNRPHRQVPQIINVFNVGKQQPNDWLKHVQEHLGVGAYYEKGGEDSEKRPISMEKEMSQLLLSQQNAAEVCPALTGNHRLAVFETISESCRTILLYGRDKWKQLEQLGLLNDLKGKKAPPRAGNAALIQQLQQCQRRRIHRAVLDPLNLLHSVLENAKHQLMQRGRLNRAKINSTASAQLIKQLSDMNFGCVLSWNDAVSQVPAWLDGNEEDWIDDVRVALLAQHGAEAELKGDKLLYHLLSLTFGRSLAERQLSVLALRDLINRLLRPLMRARVHHSCRSTFLALHLLLHNQGQNMDKRTVEEEERKVGPRIEDQLAVYEESDATLTETADGDDEKEKLETVQALQGRGDLPNDLKDRLYDDLCRAAFLDSSRMAEEQIKELCAEGWLDHFLLSTFSSMLHSKRQGITEATRITRVEDAVVAVKREMVTLIHDVLRALTKYKPAKEHRPSRKGLIRGDIWEGQYQRVLTGATAEMESADRTKHRATIKKLRKKWEITIASAAPVTRTQQHSFLSEAPVLLEGKAQVIAAAAATTDEEGELDILQPVPLVPTGRISGIVLGPNALQLPKRVLPNDHPAMFTVKPVTIKFIETEVSKQPAAEADFRPALGTGSMRDTFERHPALRQHPKRVLLEFKNNMPSSHRMTLTAYDGLLHDLERCLKSAQEATGKSSGLAPVFVPTKGRAGGSKLRVEKAKAKIDFTAESALDLSANPDTLVFVLVEREEAVAYFEAFSRAGEPPLPNVVFVIIPGANRGIRFARSCILYLASCFRQSLIDNKVKCPRLDVFHTLDDDWRNSRVFDPALIGEQCMRPCSLHMALLYAEKVMRAELVKCDGRDDLLENPNRSNRPEGWKELLKAAAEHTKDEDGEFNLRYTLKKMKDKIKGKADQGQLHECLAPYATMPAFKEEFLAALQKATGQGQKVVQVSTTQKNITSLINHNCMKIGVAQDQLVYPHYKISADRRGCTTHFLPIYIREQVNYLSDTDFFLPQQQVQIRLQKLDEYKDWFRNDRHFIREVLEPRGIGGVLLFKFDLDFARVRLGGLMSIPLKDKGDTAGEESQTEQESKAGESGASSLNDHSADHSVHDLKVKTKVVKVKVEKESGSKDKKRESPIKTTPTNKRQRMTEQPSPTSVKLEKRAKKVKTK